MLDLVRMLEPGCRYVLFVKGRAYDGRVVRVDALHVEIEVKGRVHRLATREIGAVIEPRQLAGTQAA